MNKEKTELRNEMKLKSPKELLGEPTSTEQVEELELSLLDTFADHPFKVLEDTCMAELTESISQHGIATPIIVRPKKFGRFEIVAGHRRVKASQLLGLGTIQGLVRDLDDEEAIFYMVDTNLQREQLLPSEKAFAYKMKLEAITRRGERTDLTSGQVVHKSTARDNIAENTSDSGRQIQRYIRLTELTKNFRDLTDLKKLPFNVAVELSYLKHNEQEKVLELMEHLSVTPSLEQASKLKKYSATEELSESTIDSVLNIIKEKPVKLTLKNDMREFFKENVSKKEMEDTIYMLLKQWSEEQSERE